MADSSSRSVALVHDYLLVMRGAERTFAAMAECWPAAPIHTLLYDKAGTDGWFADRHVRSSFLRHSRVGQKGFRALLPLLPLAARSLSLEGYDVVVSSSSAFAHGVRSPGTIHVCYCHSPFRYAWHEYERALEEAPAPLRPLVAATLRAIRRRDPEIAGRIDHLVANSAITRERIRRFWGRDAAIVHPPVDVDRFSIAEPEDYFLFVGEIVGHKRVEVALEAARLAGARMKVVGSGPDLARLRERYGAHAEFVGRIDDSTLASLYARARALIVPNVEEFGIAAVESQAAGRPVLAARAGGQLETVRDGDTGRFFGVDDVAALARLMAETDFDAFSPGAIKRHADRFSVARFQRRLVAEVDSAVAVRAPGRRRRFARSTEVAAARA